MEDKVSSQAGTLLGRLQQVFQKLQVKSTGEYRGMPTAASQIAKPSVIGYCC